MLLQIAEGGEAGGHGQRIAAQRAGLVDGTEGRELIHEGALAAEDADRQSAADDFAEGDQVGIEAIQLTGAAQSHAESGHHFVDNEQRAVLSCEGCAGLRGSPDAGGMQPALPTIGSTMIAAISSGCAANAALDRSEVVVGQSQGEVRDFLRNSRRTGNAEGGHAGAGFDQQSIGVAVIAAFELDDDFPARGGPRQADRRHGGLGAGADEAQLFDRGIAGDDLLCQIGFGGRGRSKAGAVRSGLLDRFDHGRKSVAEDHRSPGTEVVNVAIAIGVPQIGALAALDKGRLATHGAKGADRRVDPAGKQFFCALPQRGGAGERDGHSSSIGGADGAVFLVIGY